MDQAVRIAAAMSRSGLSGMKRPGVCYYDAVRLPRWSSVTRLRIHSMVGLLPVLLAVELSRD